MQSEIILPFQKAALKKPFIKTPLWIVKTVRYEYWPFWILFFPVFFYWLYLSLRARSFTFFTAANPGIELGGFFGESKSEILKKIPQQYLPVTLFFDKQASVEEIKSSMQNCQLSFPVIFKPDKGERGFNVEKINNEDELRAYLEKYNGKLIIQEFIAYEHELGILYYRMPDGSRSGITSVVKKEFLCVIGNGNSSIEELVNESVRARMQLPALRKKLGARIIEVLADGEKFRLEPIGNHCRGTKFLSGNDLINGKLVSVFDTIAGNMNGFYFGRFDLKVKSIDDLYEGNNIRIMEVNGVSSEPAHIYDPMMNLWKVYRDIFYNTKLIYKIALQNHKRGVKYVPLRTVFKTVRNHFNKKTE